MIIIPSKDKKKWEWINLYVLVPTYSMIIIPSKDKKKWKRRDFFHLLMLTYDYTEIPQK